MHRFSTAALPAVLALILAHSVAAQSTAVITSDLDNTLYQDTLGSLSNGAGSACFSGLPFNGLTRRAVFHFDIASAVPAGSTILTVSLGLTCTQTISGNVNMNLHAVTASWGEGSSTASSGQGGGAPSTTGDATWLHRFYPGTLWATPGGDFNPLPVASKVVGSTGFYSWTGPGMATDVQSWLNTPANNFGWILISDESAAPPTAKRFATREDANNQPQLTITYNPPILASVTPTGTGCNATLALPLSLTANGLPQIGNGSFGCSLSHGVAGGAGLFFLAATTAPAVPIGGGCNVYLDLVSLNAFLAAGFSPIGPFTFPQNGVITLPLGISNTPALMGASIAMQGVATDGASPSGFLTSNALSFVVGL